MSPEAPKSPTQQTLSEEMDDLFEIEPAADDAPAPGEGLSKDEAQALLRDMNMLFAEPDDTSH